MEENASNICPNCQHMNSEAYHFCEHCGQKNRPLKTTFYDFLKDFFDVVLNLDNKFWKTLKTLFIPGKLTKIFFQGKRKSFYHPIRLYLVAVIYLFTVLSLLKVDNLINLNGNIDFKARYEKTELVRQQVAAINNTLDSLRSTYSSKENKAIIDTTRNSIFLIVGSDSISLEDGIDSDSINIPLFFNKHTFSSEELFVSDIDEVLKSKNIHTFIERLALGQILKGARDINSFNTYIYANLTWLFLAIIPVFSLILKLFYIRRKRYYMEHFVFLLHLFAALTFLISTAMIIMIPLEWQSQCKLFSGMIIAFFPFVAFKIYYKQGIVKTFVKYLLIGLFFLTAFILTFLIFILISAALF